MHKGHLYASALNYYIANIAKNKERQKLILEIEELKNFITAQRQI